MNHRNPSQGDRKAFRRDLARSHFPQGIPALWCPPLTHYARDGSLDRARIAAHLRFLSPWVKAILVPGTTGDGWELGSEELRQLTETVLGEVARLDLRLLVGALSPDAERARATVLDMLERLRRRSGIDDPVATLVRCRVCGFAVCPPRGARATQDELERALSRTLELGVPTALYQLPQLTENEMSPQLVADLAWRFPNFLLFKDTSGADRVASSGLDLGGVFLVRGMEGDYAAALKAAGGLYDGLLLASANSFGAQLDEMCALLAAGRPEEARGLSDRLAGAVRELFRLVEAVEGGNPFANAGKLADHFHAYGPGARGVPPPRLHSGFGLNAEMVRAAGDILEAHGLMPEKGYLE